MSDKETIRVYDERAAEYALLTDDFNEKDPLLIAFIAACPDGGRVLDLGCGPGTSAAVMAQHGLLVDAVDASAEMVALAARHEGVTARHATFDEIEGDAIYDGVWANFSLLHAPRADLPRHLKTLSKALRPGGMFHIGMKTGAGEARDSIGRQYTFVKPDELAGLLRQTGLTMTGMTQGMGKGLSGNIEPWVVIQAHA